MISKICFVGSVAERNFPNLIKANSETVQYIHCRRTKLTGIINHIRGKENLIDAFKTNKFKLLVDASTDKR